MRLVSIARLFDDNREKLQLTWVAGATRRADPINADANSPTDVVGYLNLFHPTRIQILGPEEMTHVQGLNEARLEHQIAKIVGAAPPAVIITDGVPIVAQLREAADAKDVALWSTPIAATDLLDSLRSYLSKTLAETVNLHGVFMDVLGLGVLITGDSGVGKSELGLELISRGHGLVADDVVEMTRIASRTLEGRCPALLKDFIEVRGLGLLNIRTIFGETAVRPKMKLKLIVHLEKPNPTGAAAYERLPLDAQTQEILGVTVKKVLIPVAAGRNLAVLLEAAVRNHVLQLRGMDTTREFIERQARAIEGEG
jgi:HPr kinase/phosphorylase